MTNPTTPEGQRIGLDFYRTLTIPELRRRQDLAEQQIRIAHEQRNTRALERLRATHDLLSAAVYRKAFGGRA